MLSRIRPKRIFQSIILMKRLDLQTFGSTETISYCNIDRRQIISKIEKCIKRITKTNLKTIKRKLAILDACQKWQGIMSYITWKKTQQKNGSIPCTSMW